MTKHNRTTRPQSTKSTTKKASATAQATAAAKTDVKTVRLTIERMSALDAVHEAATVWGLAQKNALEAAAEVAAQSTPSAESLNVLRNLLAWERETREVFRTAWAVQKADEARAAVEEKAKAARDARTGARRPKDDGRPS